jgi:hypothetical protein
MQAAIGMQQLVQSRLVSIACVHGACSTSGFTQIECRRQCVVVLLCGMCVTGSSRHLHMPGYYVAVDHADKSVVLALRGTASVKVSV